MAAVAAAPAPLPPSGPSAPRPTSAASNRTASESRRSSEQAAKSETKDAEDAKKEEGGSPKPEGSPVNPQRPPIRPNPAVRSKFDLEPNPFEQSFSRGSHHSSSSLSDRTTPPRGGDATSIKHNALPPLSSLTSPAAADPSQFPWLANQSLRTGPLSPAMLAGPQQANNNNAAQQGTHVRQGENGGVPPEGGFDTSAFRTGFTPGTGSGFTPGYSSLMGGNFASLPLPSPNTAAFLNMVTNSTPLEGGGDQGQQGANGQSHPQDGQQHHPIPAHPPSAIPPHMQQQQSHGLSHINGNGVSQETITPNTLSALTGVFNDMSRHPQHPQPGPPHHAPHPQHPQHHPGHPQAPYYAHPQMPPQVDYAQQSANAASQAANGLFLLSQAHQELSKREEQESRGGTPVKGGRTTSTSGQSGKGQGTKRKSDAGATAAGPKPKKGRKSAGQESATPEKMMKPEMSTSPQFSGDMDSDDDMDGGKGSQKGGNGLGPGGKPETEEEKRKNFLERNRQAALKCRQRKKQWLNELQAKVEQMTVENERLQQTIATLHEEVGRLSGMLMQQQGGGQMGGPPREMAYGRPIR